MRCPNCNSKSVKPVIGGIRCNRCGYLNTKKPPVENLDGYTNINRDKK